MPQPLPFQKAKELYLNTLTQYVPIVARVHGAHHPEFHELRLVFDTILRKINDDSQCELEQDFDELRNITSDYQVPSDVCESYEAVYQMLALLDKAYQNQ